MASDFSIPDWLVDHAGGDASADPPDPAEVEREAARRYGRILSASAAASRALVGLDGRFVQDTDFADAPHRYREELDAIGRDREQAFGDDFVGRNLFRRDFGRLADQAARRFAQSAAQRETEHRARTLEDRWDSLAVLAGGADGEGRAEILRQAAVEAHRAQSFGLIPDANEAFQDFLARIEPVPEVAADEAMVEPGWPRGSHTAESPQLVAKTTRSSAPRRKPPPPAAESPLSDTERGRMLDRLAKREGGKADRESDKLTHYGVTDQGLADYKSWAVPHDPIMKKEVKDLTYADARIILDGIMRQYRADRIEDPHLRQHIFDTIVNHPSKLAVRMWQRTLNESGFLPEGVVLEEDGTLGPATRAAINGLTATQQRTLNEAMVDRRVEFYREFIRQHPKKKELEGGLINRANSFRLP